MAPDFRRACASLDSQSAEIVAERLAADLSIAIAARVRAQHAVVKMAENDPRPI